MKLIVLALAIGVMTNAVSIGDTDDTEMYHYHVTKDFPYTVGCFKGESSVEGRFVW